MSRENNILFVTTTNVIGGAEKQLLLLARALHDERYRVSVCVLKNDGGLLAKELGKSGIDTYQLNVNRKWYFWRTLRLMKVIRQTNPDVIQSWLFYDNILSTVFGNILRIPLVITGWRNSNIQKSKWRNVVNRLVMKFADIMVSNSRAGEKELLSLGISKKKVKVIYNGIESEKYPNKEEVLRELGVTQNPVVGFVGHMTYQKGLEYLLTAWQVVLRNFPSGKLVLIGDGSERQKLSRLAEKLGIMNSVIFLGRKKDARRYMTAFDVFVLPSLWEGMPNVLLESMAAGVPVVATDVGGVSEVLESGKTGLLVKSKNPSDLAEKISALLFMTDSDKERMRQCSRERIESMFSAEEMVRKFRDIYEQR